jgi:cell division septation protein DedD
MTETQGEKELILGNKQLISLFFVVVALCGVCFAMGYIIGRNSSKPAAAADAPQPQAAAPAHSQEPEPPRETGEATPDSGAASLAAQDSSAQPSSSAQAGDSSAPAKSSGAPTNEHMMTRPGRDVPEPARAPEAETSQVSLTPAPQSGGGSYLQVGAVSKVDAENLVRTLKEQKLPAMMAESPKKGLYRVLVGPYHQTADLAEAKSRLKTLGFDNAFVQK